MPALKRHQVRIAVITCRSDPDAQLSDQLYCQALTARGAKVEVIQWNGDETASSAASLLGFDAVVMRAPWDYHHDLQAFLAWIDSLDEVGVRLANPAPLVRWNVDKRYLLDLSRSGVAIPKTATVGSEERADRLLGALAEVGAEDGSPAVLKPCWGGSGTGVIRTTMSAAEADLAKLRAETPGRPILVQEFLSAVEVDGEISFIFIAGRLEHAVCKRPAKGDFRVNSRYSPDPPKLIQPFPSLAADAVRCLAALPGETPPLYARIDGVPSPDGHLICLEAEAIDPTLFFDLAPETADKFAEATFAWALSGRAC